MEKTFKEVIEILLKDKDLNRRQGFLLLKEQGVRIAQSNWYTYMDGSVVPNVNTTKEILTALDFKYNDKFINEMLENSKLKKEEYFGVSNAYIRTGISLRIRNLSKTLLEETQIRFALNERIKQTGCKNLNNYIQRLICEDIDNEILKGGKIDD